MDSELAYTLSPKITLILICLQHWYSAQLWACSSSDLGHASLECQRGDDKCLRYTKKVVAGIFLGKQLLCS